MEVAPRLESDPSVERDEISRFIDERSEDRVGQNFSQEPSRLPVGPARGWRRRQQKAKSCELCEGDLWIESASGEVVPCDCRKRRAARRARGRMHADDWWRGGSLSFAAPPLAMISPTVRDRVESICAQARSGGTSRNLWISGCAGSGKSALCAYIAQRLYPTDSAVVMGAGDLLAHLRWLGGVKGERAVEQRLEALSETPLLVLDNVDRAVRSRPSKSPLSLRESCASQDLIRIAGLLRDRQAAVMPTVLTSRAMPDRCASRLASITPGDLLRGLVGIAAGISDPFEAFPGYSEALLSGAMAEIWTTAVCCTLDTSQADAVAA